MDPHKFWDWIHGDPRFYWLGVAEGERPEDDAVYILNDAHPEKPRFAVTIQAIKDHPQETFERIFTLQRRCRIMTHVTRVVGYYAFLHNFNRSKIAENNDRHKGNYVLPEGPGAKAA